MHDGRTFGSQSIKDNLLNLDLKTEFVKIFSGQNGGHWVLRVTGTPKSNKPVSIVFYAGVDGKGGLMNINNQIVGNTPDLGDFSMTWRGKENTDAAFLRSLDIPKGELWQIKTFTQNFILQNAQKLMKKNAVDFQTIFAAGHLTKSSQNIHNVLLFQAVFTKDFQVIIKISNLV